MTNMMLSVPEEIEIACSSLVTEVEWNAAISIRSVSFVACRTAMWMLFASMYYIISWSLSLIL